MGNSPPTRTIQSLATKFEEFCNWLSENGIRISASRVQQYRDNLTELAQHFASSEQAKLKIEPTHINTFLETDELITVYEAFSQSLSDSVKAKILEVVSGPLNYKEETNTSNRARNTAFELLIASYLRDTDFKVLISGNQEDMSFDIDGYKMFLECKRPMFEHSINSNIKGAISQLKTRYGNFSDPKRSRGILAISITRALNANQLVLLANSRAALDLEMNKTMEEFFKNYKAKWHADGDTRTIGVLVYFSCISYLRGSNIPYTTHQAQLVYISNKNDDEERIIRKIHNVLKKKIETE